MSEPIKVIVRKEFKAPAEKVFDAWLDPEWLSKWMFGPDVREEEIIRLDTHPVIEGSFSYMVKRNDDIINHTGRYIEIERPAKLVFTWGIEGESEDESVVTITITPTTSGCHLTLIHELDPKWEEYAVRTQEGWSFMLEKLNLLFSEHKN